MIADPCSLGSAQFEIVIPSLTFGVSKPRAKKAAEWVHVPFGQNIRVRDGSFLPTQWTIKIRVPDATNLDRLEGYYNTDTPNTLTAPLYIGTIPNVILADLPDMAPDDQGRYTGTVTFEWGVR